MIIIFVDNFIPFLHQFVHSPKTLGFVTTDLALRCVEDQLHDWDPGEVEQVMVLPGQELVEAMRSGETRNLGAKSGKVIGNRPGCTCQHLWDEYIDRKKGLKQKQVGIVISGKCPPYLCD